MLAMDRLRRLEVSSGVSLNVFAGDNSILSDVPGHSLFNVGILALSVSEGVRLLLLGLGLFFELDQLL